MCRVKGCQEYFTTSEQVIDSVKFMCKNHPRAAQFEEIGRPFSGQESDEKIHFQQYQFDKKFDNAIDPIAYEFGDFADFSQ
jgi:hypothetical protein